MDFWNWFISTRKYNIFAKIRYNLRENPWNDPSGTDGLPGWPTHGAQGGVAPVVVIHENCKQKVFSNSTKENLR